MSAADLRSSIGHRWRGLLARLRRRRARNALIVFNWHQVSPEFDPCRHHRYTWTSLEQFEGELAYLRHEFTVVGLTEGMRALNDGTLHGHHVALTFDDGDISMAEHVLPLLRRLDLPATFFVNTAYLEQRSAYWFPILNILASRRDLAFNEPTTEAYRALSDALRRTNDRKWYDSVRRSVEAQSHLLPELQNRLVSHDWLASLDPAQFAIGVHGHEHQRFSMMNPAWQHRDLRTCVETLSTFPAFKPVFAVPFGRPHDWAPETLRVAFDLGLSVVLADGGINHSPTSAFRRIPSDSVTLAPRIQATIDAIPLRGARTP